MGMASSGSAFVRAINMVLELVRNQYVTYIDDLLAHTRGPEDMFALLHKTFASLRQFNLKLNLWKSSFFQKEVQFLGFSISGKGVTPGSEKVRAIADYPMPETLRQVRAFFGITNYFRNDIPFFARITRPLTELMRASNKW